MPITKKTSQHILDKKEKVRSRVLDVSRDMFFQYGFSKVTVDEISFRLGMSKRTIYEYFDNKTEILDQIVERYIKELRIKIRNIVDNEEIEYSDRLKRVFTEVGLSLSQITPRFSEDLRINMPEVYQKITLFKKEAVIQYFGKLLKEGRKKGFISKEVNMEMAMMVFLISIENLLDPSVLSKLPEEINTKLPNSSKDSFDAILKIFYSGVLTENGKKAIL